MDDSGNDGDSDSGTEACLFSSPKPEDGLAVHRLISACPPLDENSIYCNLLQCDHFADTSVKVEKSGELLAFISGYIPPKTPDVLFIWQVAVAPSARGQGLGVRMLQHLVESPACLDVRFMHTTVTPTNAASASMFERFASNAGAAVAKDVVYDKNRHFGGHHDSEVRFVIGPLR